MPNLLNRALDWLSRPVVAPRPVGSRNGNGHSVRGLGASVPLYSNNRPTWPTLSLDTFVDNGYAQNVTLFACVNYRASAVASAPLKTYQNDSGGQKDEISNHPLTALMMRPNPEMSGAEFWFYTQVLMDSTGFAAIEKVRATAGRVVELWHLRSDWIKPIPRDQLPPRWEYRVPGRPPKVIDSEDIMVVTVGNSPKKTYTGLPPVAVALRELGIENSATDFLKLFFDVGAMPQSALVFESDVEKPTPGEASAIREQFRQTFGGWQQWANVAILGGGIKEIVKLGFSMDEMAYPELRNLTQAQICSAYGVPPILIGAEVGLKHATYSNADLQRRQFYQDTVTMLWARLDGAITRSLLPEFDTSPNVSVEFDTSDHPALQEDVTPLWQRATAALSAGGLMLDDFRREVGLPELPNGQGQVFYLPFSITPTKPEMLIPPKPKPLPLPTATVLPPKAGTDGATGPAGSDDGATGPSGPTGNGTAKALDIWSTIRVSRHVPPGVIVAVPGVATLERDAGPVGDVFTESVRGILAEDQVMLDLESRRMVSLGRLRLNQRKDAPSVYPVPMEKRATIVGANRTAMARLADALEPRLVAFWQEQGQRIVGVLPRSEAWTNERRLAWHDAKPGDSARDVAVRDIADIAWDDEYAALENLLVGFYGQAGEVAYSQVSDIVGVSIDWDLALPKVREVLHKLATRIVGIDQTTQDDVRRVVGDALDEGVTLQELSDRLSGLFEETYANRAMTVARTESQVAMNSAQVAGYQQSGLVAYSELADNPEHCGYGGDADGLECCQRDGLVVSLDEVSRHIEGTHPNCILGVLPVLITPLGEG